MGSLKEDLPCPWISTPCIYSTPMSKAAGCNIFLKLENLQPSGSFKSRGIGNLVFRAAAAAPASTEVHFFCSSGGNAGLACVTAANAVGRPSTVVVPTTTPPLMAQRLRDLGAEVVVTGDNWAQADAHLRGVLLAGVPGGCTGVYVPPFDHPDIWDGASSLADELAEQMRGAGRLDGVVCSVGGGGLLAGLAQGIERVYGGCLAELAARGDGPRILAMETRGADSLHASVRAGELVTLPAITSVATSLGATRVAERAFAYARDGAGQVVSAVLSDADAVAGLSRFLDDARILVEPACGATVATAYNGDLRRYLGKGLTDDEWARKNVVLVVCGGSNINQELLVKYQERFGVSV